MFWVRNPSDPDDNVDVAYVRDLWLDKEWSKFRNGALISLFSSGALFIVVWLLFRTKFLHLGFIDFILLIFAELFLGYSIYAMYSQYRFFSRWERRVGLLLHLEEEIIVKKLDETRS